MPTLVYFESAEKVYVGLDAEKRAKKDKKKSIFDVN